MHQYSTCLWLSEWALVLVRPANTSNCSVRLLVPRLTSAGVAGWRQPRERGVSAAWSSAEGLFEAPPKLMPLSQQCWCQACCCHFGAAAAGFSQQSGLLGGPCASVCITMHHTAWRPTCSAGPSIQLMEVPVCLAQQPLLLLSQLFSESKSTTNRHAANKGQQGQKHANTRTLSLQHTQKKETDISFENYPAHELPCG